MERASPLPGSPPTELLPATSREHSRRVRPRLREAGLPDGPTGRLPPAPFPPPPARLSPIQALGAFPLRLTHALNPPLLEEGRRAEAPVGGRLSGSGQAADLIAYARMN